MLRTATDKAVKKCCYSVYQSVRFNATGLPKHKSSFGKKLLVTTGVVAGLSGTAVGYVFYDPIFRAKVESTIPYSKEFFVYLNDTKSSILERTNRQVAEIKNKAQNLLPARKATDPAAVQHEKPLLRLQENDLVTKEDEKPLLKLESSLKAEPVVKQPFAVEPVDVNKSPISVAATIDSNSDLKAKRNRDLETALKAVLTSSESRVKLATEAKFVTIGAINQHARLLKEAASKTEGANWEKVTEAVEKAEKASREDLAEEIDARNYLDNVRKIINEGKQDKMTRYNPLLINAAETVNKLDQQLDELKLAVRKSRDESRRINHFHDLIKRSRKVYADELKELLPGIDTKAQGSKMSEDDLNMLLAHAHLKVTQLRQQMIDQQTREEENIAKAVDEQRIADALINEEEVRLELKRLQEQTEVDYSRKLITTRKEWEEEMDERLRDVAAAHANHLEQVVRTQRQLCDIEQAQKIEAAVAAERNWNSKQINTAQEKLESIELALNSRLAADIENRRSKQFWIACQNLADSVIHGMKAGLNAEERRTPLSKELKVIKEASVGDEFVDQVVSAFSEQSVSDGVYPAQDLKARFQYLYRVARRAARIENNGGGVMGYFGSFIQNTFAFDVPRDYSAAEKFDPESLDTFEILSRTRCFVDKGDFSSAVRMAQLLKGEPGRLAESWIKDTRTHLEARFLVELLVAHAAVLNVRTTY